jgi:hypothetical protein
LLEPRVEVCLARWRLRVGVELGSPAVLGSLRPLEAPTLEDDLLWCRALLVGGRHEEVARRAALLRARAAAEEDRETAFEAGITEARAWALLGQHREELALLEALPADGADRAARRDAHAAECHAILGQYAQASQLCAAVVSKLGELSPPVQTEVGNELLAVLAVVGDLERAAIVLHSLVPAEADEPPVLYQSRFTMLFRGVLGVPFGRLSEARSLFDKLSPLFERRSFQGLILEQSELYRRFIAGELGDIGARIDQAIANAQAAGSPFFLHWCAIWRGYLAILTAAPTVELPELEVELPGLTGAIGFTRLLHAARRGEVPGQASWLESLPPVWASVMGGMVRSLAAVWSGDGDAAVSEISAGISACQLHGYRQFELEHRVFSCEILLMLGRWAELARGASELAVLAEACESERFALEAAFYRTAASEPGPRPALLERWAQLSSVAPACARRSRALLGVGPERLDRIDEEVLRVLAKRAGPWRVVTVQGRLEDQPGWGLDGLRHEVWLPDGRTLDFSARPLMWRALEEIARHGGAVPLEALARSLWQVSEYHPLRDNGRIHTLVNRIRHEIEDDPAKPTRLLTGADGYRFGDTEPVRWLRQAAEPT